MIPSPWESYFTVLCLTLDHAPYGRDTTKYTKLLWQLHNTPFIPKLQMDENRIADAIDLRHTYSYGQLSERIGILEMMISLAKRLENEIMRGTASIDRTVDWFWVMIDSLGLSDMTDDVYDGVAVSRILHRFIRRTYSPNGKGGLFTVSSPNVDMRKEEIWHQAGLYLTNVLRVEGFIET